MCHLTRDTFYRYMTLPAHQPGQSEKHLAVLRERLVALLTSRSGRALCVRCAATHLGVPHKSAHEAALKVEALAGFRRGYAPCAECGKLRIVLAVGDIAPVVAAEELP